MFPPINIVMSQFGDRFLEKIGTCPYCGHPPIVEYKTTQNDFGAQTWMRIRCDMRWKCTGFRTQWGVNPVELLVGWNYESASRRLFN